MHYRNLKNLCKSCNALSMRDKYTILECVLGMESNLALKVVSNIKDITISSTKEIVEHGYFIGGKCNNPYVHIVPYLTCYSEYNYLLTGCFFIVSFNVRELAKFCINCGYTKFKIGSCFEQSDLMYYYRQALFYELKADGAVISRDKMGVSQKINKNASQEDDTIVTIAAISNYINKKAKLYGNNSKKGICESC